MTDKSGWNARSSEPSRLRERRRQETGGRLPPDRFPPRVERQIRLSRLALLWEGVWQVLWLPLTLIGFFAALSLFDIWLFVPAWLHSLALVGTAGAVLWLTGRGFARLEKPDRAAAIRRLEQTSHLPHRPLTAFGDRLAPQAEAGSAAAQTLWQSHRARLLKLLSRLRVGLPRPAVERLDRYALRALAILLLFVGFFAAGPERMDRLIAGISPNIGAGTGGAVHVDAWVTPPSYTGIAPLFLTSTPARPSTGGTAEEKSSGDQTARRTVPEGSILTVHVQGTGRTPRLRIAPLAEDDTQARPETTAAAFEAAEGGGYEIEVALTRDAAVTIENGGAAGTGWTFDVTPDTPPTIEIAGPINVTARRSLEIPYKISDDYGVIAAELRIDLAQDRAAATAGSAASAEPIRAPLSLRGVRVTDAEETAYQDATAHPWAGLPVVLRLAATDDAGQESLTEPVELTLPERTFIDPLARAIIEQRRTLAADPAQKDRVAEFLDAFTFEPEKYIEDRAVYLGLRAAFWRLVGARRDEDLRGIYDLLWDIALAVEHGDLSFAEAQLRDLQQALKDALASGAPDEEIQALMEQLRAALDRFLAALEQQMMNATPEEMAELPPLPGEQAIAEDDLRNMLDAIENLARTGARDAARDMLSELESLLENLQTGSAGGGMTATEEATARALDKMSEIIEDQQQLMDETFEQSREQGLRAPPLGQMPGAGAQGEGADGPPGGEGGAQSGTQGTAGQGTGGQGTGGQGSGSGALGQRQGDLQQQLQTLLDDLEGSGVPVPAPFDRSAEAMGEAAGALDGNTPGDAIDPQTRALDQLRQGTEALSQQLAEQLARRGAIGPRRGQRQTDPLGRSTGNAGIDYGEQVEVPDEGEVRRAREILEELRRRASERARPQLELDYLERLLKRF